MDMAKTLVDSMSWKWDPRNTSDDYREALMEVIEEKVESGGKEIQEKPKEKKAVNESDRSRGSLCRKAWRNRKAEKRKRVERISRQRRRRRIC